VKWAAWRRVPQVGAGIEQAMIDAYPGEVRTQVPMEATLPSGLRIAGSADVVMATRVIDVKSVDGVESVRRAGPTFKQLAQVNTYLLGLIQAGELPPDATWTLVYVDRSGRDDIPVVFEGTLDEEILAEVDARLEDVTYAVEYDLNSAPRDEPHDWCLAVCPMYSHCRGRDEHVSSGLITSEEHLRAVKLYAEGQELSKTGKRLMDESKQTLAGIKGSTGEVEVSWTHVNDTEIKAFTRAGYDRLTLRPVNRTGKTPRPRKAKES
jgi:hypothetical protein